jgi:hypothetical protein
MRAIERLCVAFFVLASIVEGKWIILKVLKLLNWPEPDWGTWFGAVGAIGALIGTIVIATAEQRRRLRTERGLMYVAVSSFIGRLDRMMNIIVALEVLFRDEDTDIRISDLEECIGSLERLGSFTQDEILPLISLPNGVAARMAGCKSELAQCIDILRLALADLKSHPTSMIRPYRRAMHQRLIGILANLRVIIVEAGFFEENWST